MTIEITFGILKGRWKILLKRIDMPLYHLLDIVIITFCLHNLCIIHNDAFNMDWERKAKMEMKIEANGKLNDFQNKNIFHITCNAIKQMKGLQTIMIIEDVEDNPLNSNDNEGVDGGAQNKKENEEKI